MTIPCITDRYERWRIAFSVVKFSQAVISYLFICVCFTSFISLSLCNDTILQPEVPSQKSVCVIGRLRECLEDEDCVESASPGPVVKVVMISLNNRNSGQTLNSSTLISKPSSQLYGQCLCRNRTSCKRLLMEQDKRTPKFNTMIGDSSTEDGHRSNHFSAGWFFGALCIIVALGSVSFLVYYYGFRYGMFSYYARQFGFIDNTQVEHQLLNRVSIEDGTELQI